MDKFTFKDDGMREKRCPKCTHYLGMMHLGEKYNKALKCPKCKHEWDWHPPEKMTVDGEKKIKFGPPGSDSIFTADLTDEKL
jgi:predicted Zn-ribbon and HTH transcriptional regulator